MVQKRPAPVDVKKAQKILDEDHYGLEKVKERILEFLSVQKLTGKLRGPILCSRVRPARARPRSAVDRARTRAPSLCGYHWAACAMKRKFAVPTHLRRRFARAHHPGLCTAGVKNPVFMLDEIDKLGYDAFRGDPSALLEALDPEQNHAFSDHYVEEPVDLSDVMFITTANLLDPVPPALRDRMEVIEFPGYTEDEKFHIAKKYLVPKQLEENGLKDKPVAISDETLREIIVRTRMKPACAIWSGK